MSRLSNFDREMGEQRIEQERLNGVNAVRRILNSEGNTHCVDCDDEIEERRRHALPSATRCVTCQEKREKR